MTLKKMCTLGIFVVFGLCFLTHFLYNWFPNFLSSILFPVNESIWEHMKMIVSSIVIWKIISYFFLKKFNIKFSNYMFSISVMVFLSIIVFLIIYLPIYSFLGNSFLLNIICLFITIYFVFVIDYYIMQQNHIKYGFVLGLIGIIFIYFLFFLLTYFAPKFWLFIDPISNKYGLKISK